MNEDFLQYVWLNKLYPSGNHRLHSGEEIEIIHPGFLNSNAGPDFFNAKVKIDGTLWAGNVEIHLQSSDWNRHRHQHDKAYNNVILHVVGHHDEVVFDETGEELQTFVLQPLQSAVDNFKMLSTVHPIACQAKFNDVPSIFKTMMLERMVVERYDSIASMLKTIFEQTLQDWEQAFFILLCRSFGFGVNAQPFEQLGRQTPFKIIQKHIDSPFQVEALLLGQAGMLSEVKDDYSDKLKTEYLFLQHKYQLKPIDGGMWKYSKLRPPNFPSIRIAQMVQLLVKCRANLSLFYDDVDEHKWINLMSVKASGYWETHFRLGQKSRVKSVKHLGETAHHLIIINAILPFIYFRSQLKGDEILMHKIFEILSLLPPETNHLVDYWKNIGCEIENAFQTQAFIFLFNQYCSKNKCLQCQIGHKVVSS